MALKIYSAYLDVCMYVGRIYNLDCLNPFLREAVLPRLENCYLNKGLFI